MWVCLCEHVILVECVSLSVCACEGMDPPPGVTETICLCLGVSMCVRTEVCLSDSLGLGLKVSYRV